jgi:hypothetical protein
MAIDFTFLSRLALCAFVVVTGVVHAQDVRCPPFYGSWPLSNAVVFDGPPDQKADIMPDISRSEAGNDYASWDVGYVYEAGRQVFLVCRYSSAKGSISM